MKLRPDPRLPLWKGTGAVLAAASTVALPVAALAEGARQVTPQPAAPQSRTINLSFYNASLVDVMRAISLQSGVGIVVGPSAGESKVTVRLLNVSIEEALRLVTGAAGLGYRRTGNTYLIASLAELRRSGPPEAATTYSLKNIPPLAAKTLIEAALPSVTVQSAEGVSAVIITGSETDVREAERLLSLADVAAPAPPPISEIITPKNVPANLLSEILQGAAPGVTITVRGGTVIVTGSPEAVERVRALLPGVDVPGGAGRRVEVYNIKYSSAQALAAMLTSAVPSLQVTPSAEPYAPVAPRFQPLTGTAFGSGSGSGSGTASGGGASGGAGGGLSTGGAGGGVTASLVGLPGGVATSTVKSRALILSGRDTDVEEALRLLNLLDVAPIQVEIEARLVDVSLDNTFNLGIQWGTVQQSGSDSGSGSSSTQTFVQGASGSQFVERQPREAIRFGRFDRSSLLFAAQLQFLETKGRSKTLANPRISVIDNEDASIFIGDILRFQVLALTSATAGSTFTVQEVPVGIALLVRPRVNDNGEITMKIKPVVSSVTGTVQGLPQTSSREADTTLRVRDGETIVIGGLIRDQDIKTVEEVPILSKIPLLGELFRNRSTRRGRSEVILFLTPHLLRDNGAEAAAATQSALPDALKMKPSLTAPDTAPKR